MRTLQFLILKVFFQVCTCFDGGSFEMNQLEITPIYDIILFNDIADVLKDFDNDVNSPSDLQSLTESESNENIEDLLLEYQHYLDRAHKQHLQYLEKVNSKNKVPLLRHEKFSKKSPGSKAKEERYSFPQNIGFPPKPMSSFSSFMPEISSINSNTLQSMNLKTEISDEKNHKTAFSSCYCKTREFPCNCGCKQCIIPFEFNKINDHYSLPQFLSNWNAYTDPFVRQRPEEKIEDDFKIKIKLDIKLPKILERLTKTLIEKGGPFEPDTHLNKVSSLNYVSPLKYNPANVMRFNTIPQYSQSIPLQRITIHKKKKFRTSNNKKHKKKTINITPDKNEATEMYNNLATTTVENSSSNGTRKIESEIVSQKSNNTAKEELPKIDKSNSKEIIYVTLNISNDNDNQTEARSGNSIETGYFKTKDNYSANDTNFRDKRETNENVDALDLSVKPLKQENVTHDKKLDKLLSDSSLLYWPENGETKPNNVTDNINSLILKIEKQKTKLNMSTENIRSNHSVAIERAIFGDVNWNDVDTVAPVFMSFVGKYVHGILTFCSDDVCHSMKCADKICIHRNCDPSQRHNNKGHCLGSNSTESSAKMESIMDLPSNLALEIVDILQDKMLGKMYGKMTVCISVKCVTFVASKKVMLKSKCTSKELNHENECVFNKNS